MLTFTGNQNQINPHPNNCCGGFALEAILNELALNNGLPPLPNLPDHGIIDATLAQDNILGTRVYLLIQNIQDNFPQGGVQEHFVNNAGISNGTRRSLPSALVIASIMVGVRVADITVHYDNAALLHLGFPQNLIDAEINLLRRLNVTINQAAHLVYAGPPADEYDIILCEGGGHWISDDDTNYYNPDDGTNDNDLADIQAMFSGLYIRINN